LITIIIFGSLYHHGMVHPQVVDGGGGGRRTRRS